MTRYASPGDISSHALQSGALANPGRVVDVDASLDLCALDVHMLESGDPVEFRAEGSNGALPAPLVEGTTYYAIVLSQSRFQVAATSGGAAIDLTTAGENVIATFPVPVDAALDWASRLIDENLPAHVVEILEDEIPEIVRFTCAELAGAKLLNRGGTMSDALAKIVDGAMARLAKWAKGVPVRNGTKPANLAISAGSTTACAWRRYGGL